MKTQATKWGLIRALVVAAAFTPSKLGWKHLLDAFKVFLGIIDTGGERASQEEYDRRISVCRSCPIFFAKLQTCGSPLRKGSPELGCWCYELAKAEYTVSTCWLDDNLGEEAEHGWKANQQSKKSQSANSGET